MKEIQLIIEEIEAIINKLQQQQLRNAYEELNITIGKLIDVVSKLKPNEDIQYNIERLNKTLMQCVIAMEEKDNVLLADILEYEVIDILTEIIE
ncbi:MAG: hypothetical protein K0S61_3815 [Anaerocolumna sp.]|jgi:formylmethanofuran dehydrogenase subunit E-like metal-binding protein|nr:hypothetical protein [Anaerocolumna sp.]